MRVEYRSTSNSTCCRSYATSSWPQTQVYKNIGLYFLEQLIFCFETPIHRIMENKYQSVWGSPFARNCIRYERFSQCQGPGKHRATWFSVESVHMGLHLDVISCLLVGHQPYTSTLSMVRQHLQAWQSILLLLCQARGWDGAACGRTHLGLTVCHVSLPLGCTNPRSLTGRQSTGSV